MVIMNGVEYASAPKDGFPPIIYSDEEREIGVWRDGKPLYSIVISGTASANFDITTGVIPTIDNLVTSHIHVKSNGGTQINNYFMSSSDYARVRMDINPNTLHVDFGSSYPAKPLNYDLMLLYTKITDTPGSGKYTTYGGLSHHYSEKEQVVGTWIDGKPLYEVTVRNINLTHNSWTTVFNGSSIGALVRRCWGGIGIGGNTTSAYCDLNYYRNGNEFACCSIGANVSVFANVYSPEYLIYCVVQYTKTTD